VASSLAFATRKTGQLLKEIGNKRFDRLDTEINYFLLEISVISSAFCHVERGRRVHYGNVVV